MKFQQRIMKHFNKLYPDLCNLERDVGSQSALYLTAMNDVR